ncbi:UNVERIFIED_CONTAM: hypothetical protein PYX00_000700 [Menopon gallinae]|uniref:Protein lingerer n=1 Tax=Menopon gallinae TaxID=328185 RepID=A0AAW2IBD6_9NEOP
MNTQTRTAQRGGKNSKLDSISSSKTQKNDAKSENKSLDPRTQPTAEQMRIAQLISKEEDDTNLKEKVKQVMDATRKTEDDAITALHDSDHDINKAVNMLLEGEAQGEWETSGKKKKNRQPTGAKSNEVANNRTGGEGDGEEGETPVPAANTEREKPRNRGGPPRLRGRGGNDRVSGRGRENKENEQNTEEGFTKNRGEGGFRRGGRGMANGPGSRSGRGGRGGRLGPRTFQSRDKSGGSFPRSIETWNNPVPESSAENNLKMESWGGEFPSPEDWDNEEYTGSLAESKVFTPSGGIEPSIVAPENLQDSSNQEMLMSSATQDYHQASHLPPSPLPVGVGTLNAAQTQYLSQLTAQSENLKSAVGIGSGAAGSTSVYTGAGAQGANSYQNSASQRVTYQSNTGSSYPVNAGNVPGGNTTYQGSSASFHSANQPSVFTSQTYNNSGVGSYGSQLSDGPGTDAVQSTQPARTKTQRARVPPPSKIPQSAVEMPEDSINNSISFLDVQFGGLEFGSESGNFESGNSATASSTSDQTTSTATTTDTQTSALDGYSTSNASAVKNNQANLVNALTGKSVLASSEGMSTTEHKTTFNAPSSRVASSNSGLDLTKSDVGLTYSAASSVNYQTYQSQKSNSTGTAVYQQSGYSTGNFSSSTPQVTSSSSSYSTNQSQSNNFSTPSGSNSFPNSSYSQASNPGVVNYPNTSNTYQSANSFPNTNQTYQSSGQSVYGSPLSSGYPSANQYQNSYGVSASSSNQNKMNSGLTSSSKDSQEYAASTTVSSLTSTANSGLTNAALTSAAQTVNTTTTKVSSATTKSSVVANIPPGVPPIMGTHQYIMSQGSMPYFHQAPTMYSFEDIQLLQQRIPHMTATQAHQQPMMNPSLPPGYAYFYGAAGMMPGSFQYGTPALYPIPATNAHGSTATSQYAKPGSYASTYGSGYEGLSQTQDYQKSAYVSTNQTQSKTGVGVTTGSSGSSTSDLSASMYGKTHTALGKVNSYEKQGFHSGTPPPFNLAGNQNTGMAPSGAYGPQLFIPTMQPQQHHSTALMHQPLHQDSASSTGPRNQSSAQPNKTGNKQNYNPYWSPSMN